MHSGRVTGLWWEETHTTPDWSFSARVDLECQAGRSFAAPAMNAVE
jgi:hypothetical protein